MRKKKKVLISYGAALAGTVLVDSLTWNAWNWQSQVLVSLALGGCVAGLVAILVLIGKGE